MVSNPELFEIQPAGHYERQKLAAECEALIDKGDFGVLEFRGFSRRMVEILGLLKSKYTPFIHDRSRKKVINFEEGIEHNPQDAHYQPRLGIYEEWEGLPEREYRAVERYITEPYTREHISVMYASHSSVIVVTQDVLLPTSHQIPELSSYVTGESTPLYWRGELMQRHLEDTELRSLSSKIFEAWNITQNQA